MGLRMGVDKPLLSSVLVLLLQTHFSWVECKMVTPSQPIVAPVGSDVTLPCQLDPVSDLRDLVVEWTKPDLKPPYVHIRRDGLDLVMEQNSVYQGRSRMNQCGLQCGDMSLQLSRVRLSDGGTYRCFVPKMGTSAEVTLYVVSVSPVSLTLTKDHSGSPVLRCESRGWYPKPQLDWLDSEGKNLSRGGSEATLSKDESYSISSSLSVGQNQGKSFTCRVRQPQSVQSRQADIIIRDEVLEVCGSCTVAWALFGLLFCSVAAAGAGAIVLWKRKTHEPKTKEEELLKPLIKEPNDEQKLNGYKDACLRITQEIGFLEEHEKGLTSKQFLVRLKEELHRFTFELSNDIQQLQDKLNDTGFLTMKDKIKKMQDKTKKHQNNCDKFRNILAHTVKEIDKHDDLVCKLTERKGKLKADYEHMNKLLEDEKKRLAAAVQPEIQTLPVEEKAMVVDETAINDLCSGLENSHLDEVTPGNNEEQSLVGKVEETKEQESTDEGAKDSPDKTD